MMDCGNVEVVTPSFGGQPGVKACKDCSTSTAGGSAKKRRGVGAGADNDGSIDNSSKKRKQKQQSPQVAMPAGAELEIKEARM